MNHIRSVIEPPDKDNVIRQDNKILTLTVKGFIVSTEDINILLSNYNDLREVNVYCLHTIYIDGDLTMPGVNLTIISPNCIVVGERLIDLKG